MKFDGDDLHVVIDHPNRTRYDEDIFKRVVFESSIVNYLPRGATIFEILFQGGFFPSKNEARRNWKQGYLKFGMNRYARLGKFKRNIFVLNLPDDFPKATWSMRIWNQIKRLFVS